MSSFGVRHHNRKTFPTKHVLVCEDDLDNQIMFAKKLRELFDPQGHVQFDFVCSAVAASLIMQQMKVDLIILDHDMPYGFGSELLHWMKRNNKYVPIITASGIPENNDYMEKIASKLKLPCHKLQKKDVFEGKADGLIQEAIKERCLT
jgi:CheY-like chemotaxis protein